MSTGFLDDPVATHSGQFPLARPDGAPVAAEPPSGLGVRPWVLRDLEQASAHGLPELSGWVYDPIRQVTIDRDGTAVTMATAKTKSQYDGDEGPSEPGEDWLYDFCPDSPLEA